MKISIKTEKEIEKMRVAGKLAAEVLEMIEPFVVPGVSTEELDNICYEHIVNVQKAIPANVGYRGFEKTICSSINQVICHGIPDKNRIITSTEALSLNEVPKHLIIIGGGVIGLELGVFGLPETFIVNSKGIIMYKHLGPLTKKIITNEFAPFIQ